MSTSDNCRERKMALKKDWRLRSSTLVEEGGDLVSAVEFAPDGWYPISVPSTVQDALVKNGVYPDPRIGLNSFSIPDASDEFNAEQDLAKYSHLPDKRNPWLDPYWFRTEFDLPEAIEGKHVWLNFKGINYRADVWLNGEKIADHSDMVGMYRRFRIEATSARVGKNCLAVMIHQVDHPGKPETQLDVFCHPREFQANDIMNDVTFNMSVGYDCMPAIRDRLMGIWQGVDVDWTGPVDIRHPFVETDLPLPETAPAYLTVSAELVNLTDVSQKGVLSGVIKEVGVRFEKTVDIEPGKTGRITFHPKQFPQLVIDEPRLWWPLNYGEPYLHNLSLAFEKDEEVSDNVSTAFGIRKVTKELHEIDGFYGLRISVNGRKIFSRGGWLQPELLMDWPAERIDAEIRLLASSNLNTVSFEDLPMPPDELLDACDRYGMLYWNCFYGSLWVSPTGAWRTDIPEKNYPLDHDLLEQCTVDIIKRYRNHPSLIMYSCMGEGLAGRDVYARWRRCVHELDTTRLFIPTADVKDFFADTEWIQQDIPTGVDDAAWAHKYEPPSEYYKSVRAAGEWMFSTEIPFSASLPPLESLRKFIPDLGETAEGAPFPLNSTWTHHGANSYFKPFDTALREIFGEPATVEDYCRKAHVLSAEHHRAVSEAVNHRMWDITSGSWEWKINSCWPSVQWQIYDWYLRAMPSLYYYRLAFEPLHVQLDYLDFTVTVINNCLEPKSGLRVSAQLYDFDMNLKREHHTETEVDANTYRELFRVPELTDLSPVFFVKLVLADRSGSVVSDNFYWLCTNYCPRFLDASAPLAPSVDPFTWLNPRKPKQSELPSPDFKLLADLPPVALNVACEMEDKGQEQVVYATVENPGDGLAFFVHLAVTNGVDGDEVLPSFWDNNYFCLLPGESRRVSVAYPVAALSGAAPAIRSDGWNIEPRATFADLPVNL